MENRISSFPRPSQSAGLKAFLITLLTLMLLIPTFFIANIVDERDTYRCSTISEVTHSWGDEQTITGPILTVPYYDSVVKIERYVHFLPKDLTINGTINPEKRYRGIYEAMVYSSKIGLKGNFSELGKKMQNLGIPNNWVYWERSLLTLGITDLRGIEENVVFRTDDTNYTFQPGITNGVLKSGIHTQIPINPASTNSDFVFDLSIALKGSSAINIVPVGSETKTHLEANWPHPKFSGAFLPDARTVTSNGFTADWKVLQLNRNFSQVWKDEPQNLEESAFTVELFLPADQYQRASRIIKYAILMIGMTFLAFFIVEIMRKIYVHPLHYALIGAALCLFYLLELSFSEYLGFDIAYAVSTIMTIGLVVLYGGSVIKSGKFALMVGIVMGVLYGFIYIIVRMEEASLLAGSLGLFILLAIIMFITRRINWSGGETPKGLQQDSNSEFTE